MPAPTPKAQVRRDLLGLGCKSLGFAFLVCATLALYIHFFRERVLISESAFWQFRDDVIENKIDVGAPSILILGHSMALTAVDARRLPGALILACPSGTFIQNYYVLKHYLEGHRPPAVLLLFPNISHSRDAVAFWKYEAARGRLPWADYVEIFRTCRASGDFPMEKGSFWSFFGNLLAYRLNYFPNYLDQLQPRLDTGERLRIHRSIYAALRENRGYLPLSLREGQHLLMLRGMPKAEQRRFDPPERFTASKTQDEYLRRILALADREGIRSVLLDLPFKPGLKRRLEETGVLKDYLAHFSAIVGTSRLGRTWVLHPDYPDSYFADPTHLNPEGAAVYTAELARRLAQHAP
ncbi:MAG: hypothetical protein NTY77_08115 [Elusimicrobia bacterium]|nr:hypothetical protein [Elusimicrobiota bacterium]